MVSGGAGFIGSHLCEALLAHGMQVVALDNFITGSRENLKTLEGNPDFEFRQADVNQGVFLDGDVRYVLHFASPASPPRPPLFVRPPPPPKPERSSGWATTAETAIGLM